MTAYFFRRRALEKASSPEELDRLVKVALPRTWVALGGIGVLVLAAVVWAVVARVPTSVQAPGYLLRQGGIHVGAAPTAGVVLDVRHEAGDRVAAGELLGLIEGPDGTVVPVRSPSAGNLIEISVNRGDYLEAGRPLGLLDSADQPLVLYAYLPHRDAKQAQVGDPVDIALTIADPSEFGYLRGHVERIAAYPATQERLTSILRDRSVLAEVNELGPVVETLVRLDRDPDTPSGFAWSVGEGPPFRLTVGTPAQTSVVTGEKAPIDYVTG
jgi:multidrug efflux pump subunit AcrA (membrane-fusion protein)